MAPPGPTPALVSGLRAANDLGGQSAPSANARGGLAAEARGAGGAPWGGTFPDRPWLDGGNDGDEAPPGGGAGAEGVASGLGGRVGRLGQLLPPSWLRNLRAAAGNVAAAVGAAMERLDRATDLES